MKMRKIAIISMLVWGLSCALPVKGAEKETLDVFTLKAIPAGTYEVQLDYEGKQETLRLSITNNRATTLKASTSKLSDLSGDFELIGNGVFLGRLKSNAGGKSQWWLFRPDGSAVVKENPDRGEKQTAKPVLNR